MSPTNTNPSLQHHYTALREALAEQYDTREAQAIANRLVAHLVGLQPHERVLQRNRQLTEKEQAAFRAASLRLQAGEPIQYVIGYEEFCGFRFKVDKRVLIPRPETEELVQHALDFLADKPKPSVLEFGTGSGCIALAIAAQRKDTTVYATDISQRPYRLPGITCRRSVRKQLTTVCPSVCCL